MDATRVIEGRWEEVAGQVKLAGRNVRVEFRGDTAYITVAPDGRVERLGSPSPWLRRLVEFSNSHPPLHATIDLNRDRLFEELAG